jgi:hypothetical protein
MYLSRMLFIASIYISIETPRELKGNSWKELWPLN